MGRRSISTTKSGKFMNPTDQARKEARKKELKKNKKQRQMVRAAVLKGKDPNQLISEMEKIDRMEFDVNQPPVLNEKVLKDKRRKLKETFDRVLRLYEKEDREQWSDLKRMEVDYDRRRGQLIQYYESVKHAQSVQIDDIPLPAMPNMEFSHIPLPSEIPLPAPPISQPQSILKKPVLYGTRTLLMRSKAPGVPPGPPPQLSDCEDEDEIAEIEKMEVDKPELETVTDSEENRQKQRKIRFADDGAADETEAEKDTRVKFKSTISANILAGQELAEFLKEVEESQMQENNQISGDKLDLQKDDLSKDGNLLSQTLSTGPSGVGPGSSMPPGPPPGMIFRPPPLRHGMPPPPRLPPGPPPGRPAGPPGPPPGLPPRLTGPPMRLPPGPPPGMPPPRMLRPPGLQLNAIPPPPPGMPQQSASNPNVLSAPPSLINRPKTQEEEKKTGATIEAKPQIRNLSADVTRFTPTSLRVKREDRGRKRETPKSMSVVKNDGLMHLAPKIVPSALPTKDDAYDQFMKEMEGLL